MRCRASINVVMLGCIGVWAGCAGPGETALQGPDPHGEGVLGIQVVSSPLLDDAVRSYRIRLYHGVPKDWPNDSPYFHSGCFAASLAFQVNRVKVGSGYTIVYEGYSDAPVVDGDRTVPVCATLSALGVRGDISITANGTGQAFYFIQLNRRDAITAFPLPGPDLDPAGTGLPCTEDAYCRELVPCDATENCPGGQKFRVHPRAVCDEGFCRLPSLFPLNVESGRAFHAAVSVGDGTVALIGGFDALDATGMAATSPPRTEEFNGNTSLFATPVIADLDESLAGSAVAVDDAREIVGLFGGVPAVRFKENLAALQAETRTCPSPGSCPVEARTTAFLLDAARHVATRYTLPVPAFGGVAAVVRGPAGEPAILYRPGMVQATDTEIRPGDRAFLLLLGANAGLSCADPLPEEDPADAVLACRAMEGLTPRAAPAGVCYEQADGLCTRYLAIGGHGPAAGRDVFAEVFDASSQTITVLAGDASIPKTLAGAVAVRVGNRVWTFGGLGEGQEPTVFSFTPDFQNHEIHLASVVSGDDLADLRRVFHQATPLADGRRVLVTGGRRDDTVLNTYLVLDLDGDRVTVKGRGVLDQPRFGHAATRIRGSILENSVLITGGVSALGDEPRFAPGAEIYLDLD